MQTTQIEAELALRTLARRNLIDQMRYLYQYHYCTPFLEGWHHSYLAEHLQALLQGQIKLLMVNMPPSYGKTEMCVRQFVPYALGQNPSTEVIYTSYGADLSEKVSLETRNIISSKPYSNLHKVSLSAEQNQRRFWQTTKRGYLFATSTGGAVTGVHAHILIIDDPLKVDDSQLTTALEHSWRYFSESLTSRLRKNASTLIIMQRLHPNDIVGRILREYPSDFYTHLCLRAVESRAIVYDFGSFHYERPANEPLCPAWQSADEVAMIRVRMGEIGFKTQYLQDPEISEAGFFAKDAHKEINELDLPEQNLYIFIDPAMSLKSGSDERAIVCLGWSKDSTELEQCIVYECSAGVWELETFIEHIISMMLRYKNAQVFIESDGGGIILYQTLLPAIVRTNAKLTAAHRETLNQPIQTFAAPRKTSKNQRIIAMHTYYNSGQLAFLRNGVGLDALLRELWAFNPNNPNNKDNRIDALSQSFNQRGKLVFPLQKIEESPQQKYLKRFKQKRSWNV